MNALKKGEFVVAANQMGCSMRNSFLEPIKSNSYVLLVNGNAFHSKITKLKKLTTALIQTVETQ